MHIFCCEVGNGYCRLIATTDLASYCGQTPCLYIRPARPFALIRHQLGLGQASVGSLSHT